MQNLEWYLADLKSTEKNTIETVEKSLADMFIRLVRKISVYKILNWLPSVLGSHPTHNYCESLEIIMLYVWPIFVANPQIWQPWYDVYLS